MSVPPTPEDFRAIYDAGEPQVLWRRMVADVETPVSAMLKLADGRENAFLLESVEGGVARGRYSFIALEPDLIWRARGDRAEVNRSPRLSSDAFEADGPPLASLRRLVAESHIDLPRGSPPMAAGLVGYMSYDFIRLVETLPDGNPDTIHAPDALYMRPTVMVIFDTVDGMATIVTPVRPQNGVSAKAASASAHERLQAVVEDIGRPAPRNCETTCAPGEAPAPVVSNVTRERFREMVEKAKDYILAGDVFQVVLSQRFRIPFQLPPFSLYRALRRTNPSPFLFHLQLNGFALIGSSPEILVRLRDGKVTVRPIAGTRPRGETPEQDRALARDLLASPKECAEHLMLLDLGRNDVGRVAKIGSVAVTERMTIERYSHVMHIASNIEGDIAEDQDALSALLAGFPAGTVSGAPKIRAMEIIDELESERRCFYAGAVGYISADGQMDSCIALRTAMVKDGEVILQAGAGVVADSDPDAEYEECRDKARAIVRAAEEAVRFAGGSPASKFF